MHIFRKLSIETSSPLSILATMLLVISLQQQIIPLFCKFFHKVSRYRKVNKERVRDWSSAEGVPRKRYGAKAEVRKARRREFSCFCVAKCEPFGEQKKTREVSVANDERPIYSYTLYSHF